MLALPHLTASPAGPRGNLRPSFCIVVLATDGVSSREQYAEQGTHDFFHASIAMGSGGSFPCLLRPFDRVDPKRSPKDLAVHSAVGSAEYRPDLDNALC